MSEIANEREATRPWEEWAICLAAGDAVGLGRLLETLPLDERRYAMSRLSGEEQVRVVELLDATAAAGLLEILPEAQAVDILEMVSPGVAADIVDPDEAAHLRERFAYAWDTAGGLMNDSYAVFPEGATIDDVLTELGAHADRYGDMDVQYVYIVTNAGHLRGVIRLRDLVLTARNRPVAEIMIQHPVSVRVGDDFEKLRQIFEKRDYIGLPVVDDTGLLVGVVTRQAVREATSDHQTEDYLHASGILGGEELRSMPMLARCRRRLAWLGPNIVLNLIAASVIARYESTLEAVIALAVFLPIVSDMSGCSGNQAVAVSIRELTLGLIKPHEYRRIVWKEGVLGLVNGIVLGAILGTIATLWKDNIWLGLVVGGALALNTVLSALLGGCVPLMLKRFKIDPALAAGPILTTCTDMCGFFLVLNLASAMLSRLT